ncbi:methyltransferase domain-containing protein [Bernardetia sp. OM2101]|uniref:class I SAM-dependent methyltransferase n=1 Tax=Bernardetia sp. OM2101 TaxID=3344876 RepID=UPI0035D065D0
MNDQTKKLPYLNLGCGTRFHTQWTNLDFVKTGEGVIAHNLLNGIPFEDNTFEVVYHSHVLEHFSKEDAQTLLEECRRVLKSEGILRIAIPDLEQIARFYIKSLEEAVEEPNDKIKQLNHQWMIIELIDQASRHQGGGQMAKHIFQPQLLNQDFVFQRIGKEGEHLRNWYLENTHLFENKNTSISTIPSTPNKTSMVRRIKDAIKIILGRTIEQPEEVTKLNYQKVGQFRLSGEIHQWMYDRYSIKKLLQEVGFDTIEIKTGFESSIPNWNYFQLDVEGDKIRKPDSLFIEAIKK